MTVRSLGYLGVASPRALDWSEFGPAVLGMEVVEPPAGVDAVRLRMDDAVHRITVYSGEADRLLHLGWDVGDEDALEAFVEACDRRGLSYERATDGERAERGVMDMLWVLDPAGFRHELFYGQDQLLKAFHPGRPLAGFVTGQQGLGHAVLVVPELAQADRFCRDVLGMRPSDHITAPFDLRFYHCNPRHHSLALGGMPRMRGLHHVMVQLADFDDVGVAYDECQRRGLPIAMTLGRHVHDRMVSFYVRTPSGFEVEYGWGAIHVEASWNVARYDRPSVWGHHPAHLPPGAGVPVGEPPVAPPAEAPPVSREVPV
jgi:extradiol dioxygenase